MQIWGKCNHNSNPDLVFIWKVPPRSCQCANSNHVGHVTEAIEQAKEEAPAQMCKQALNYLNHIINVIADVPAETKNILSNFVFLGDAKADKLTRDDHVQLVVDMAAGLPIDESMLARSLDYNGNSRRGGGVCSTKFSFFGGIQASVCAHSYF